MVKVTSNYPKGMVLVVQNTKRMTRWTYYGVKEYEQAKKELVITFSNNDVIRVSNSDFDKVTTIA